MRGIFCLLVGWCGALKLDESPRVAKTFHRSHILPADTASQPFSEAELRHLYGALVASCLMFTNIRSVLSVASSCAELASHVSLAQVFVGTLRTAMVSGLQRSDTLRAASSRVIFVL